MEEPEEARIMLSRAVELVPEAVELRTSFIKVSILHFLLGGHVAGPCEIGNL